MSGDRVVASDEVITIEIDGMLFLIFLEFGLRECFWFAYWDGGPFVAFELVVVLNKAIVLR